MPLVSSQLAALALAGLQAAAPCGCAGFALDAAQPPAHGALSDEARALRDFVLFSHRRIGADLIRQRGPYLDVLSTALAHCPDEAIKLRWLRQQLAATSDTRALAERIASQADTGRACPSR